MKGIGVDPKTILEDLTSIKKDDINWKSGRCFGYVYNPGEVGLKLIKDSFIKYMSDTVLDVKAFPSSKILEHELNGIAIEILGGDQTDSGSCFTTGGTESIFLSVLAHREWAKKTKNITEPNIVIPDTIHPAFNKACFYLGIKPIVVAAGPDFRADHKKMEYYIDDNTIMIAGSAPSYGVGQIDPLWELGCIAEDLKIGFVIDACVGGGIIPFMKSGPELSFKIPGVTAITLDWHKWYMSIKGSSSVVYRDKSMLDYQCFVHSAWMGYSIVNPSVTSTRSTGHIAATVAIIKYFGLNGYRKITDEIMYEADKIKNYLSSCEVLELIGEPELNVFAFSSSSEEVNIFTLQEVLKNKGWFIQPQLGYGDMPPSCHISVNYSNVGMINEFIIDLDRVLKAGLLSSKTELDMLSDMPIKKRDKILKSERIEGSL